MHNITHLLNKKDLECVNVLENWIESTVTLLKDNNLSESKLISQYHGQLMIERLRTDRKMPKRKREINAVAELINPLKETITKIIEPVSNKLKQSKIIVNRMLSSKRFNWNEGLNYRDYILAVWRTLLTEHNTQADANTLLKLVGEEDALKLIASKLKPINSDLN